MKLLVILLLLLASPLLFAEPGPGGPDIQPEIPEIPETPGTAETPETDT